VVERVGPGENHQVPDEVQKQIGEEEEAGQSDEQLGTDGRREHPAERHQHLMIAQV
jgi:hypothetical protein